jgi:aspartate/methionine/tyrosine aminotransferase
LTSVIGMLSVFMAFIEPGDEVIIFEPYFDQLASPYHSHWMLLKE